MFMAANKRKILLFSFIIECMKMMGLELRALHFMFYKKGRKKEKAAAVRGLPTDRVVCKEIKPVNLQISP